EAHRILESFDTKNSVVVAQAVEELKSGNAARKYAAGTWLEKAPVEEALQRDVTKALEPLLTDSNAQVRASAMGAFKGWATKDNVPGLIAVLTHHDPIMRRLALEALGRLKDERAVVPVALRLADFSDRQTASDTLKAMGSMAEHKDVIKGLYNPDPGVRAEVCHILGAIGTNKSIEALNRVAKADKNKEVVLAALSAVKA